jgi:hypothetical protein
MLPGPVMRSTGSTEPPVAVVPYDAGDPSGYRVHHDRADQRSEAPRHIQADPRHRHDAPFHGRAVGDLGDHGLLELGLTCATESGDRLLEPGTNVGVERGGGSGQLGRIDPQRGRAHPVEPFPVLENGLLAAHPDVLAQRRDDLEGMLYVDLGAWQHPVVAA